MYYYSLDGNILIVDFFNVDVLLRFPLHVELRVYHDFALKERNWHWNCRWCHGQNYVLGCGCHMFYR